MLVNFAIADAVGGGYEFQPPTFISRHKHNLLCYRKHGLDDLEPGKYTDDTQMTLALMELLINNEELSPENIAEYFVRTFKRDPRPGYAKKFYQFLMGVKDGTDFLSRIQPNSIRSGAAMRSIPLGILDNEKLVKLYSSRQAKITHNTVPGIISSQAVALVAHGFLYNKIKEPYAISNYLSSYLSADEEWDRWEGRVPCEGMACARAAFSILKNSGSLKQILSKSICLGGDTDTVAALAVGLASLAPTIYSSNFPPSLYAGLENDKYGKDYLELVEKAWINLKK